MITVHHIGYLVKNIENSLNAFEMLGYQKTYGPVYDSYRDIDVVFLKKDGYIVELISPSSEQSVVSNLLKTYKNAPYHICYKSDTFTEDLGRLEKKGFIRFDGPSPVSVLGGKKTCFLFNMNIGMIELLEKGNFE